MKVLISTKKLEIVYPIYDVDDTIWGVRVSKHEVTRCLNTGNLNAKPFQTCTFASRTEYNHAARIAWLAKHDWSDAIEMDVGCPLALGYFSPEFIPDGNHRLAAAIHRQDVKILVDYSGETDYFNHLFKRKRKRYLDL